MENRRLADNETEEMLSLGDRIDGLTIIPRKTGLSSSEFEVRLQGKFIIGLNQHGAPCRTSSLFLTVEVPGSYPEEDPVCRTKSTSTIPFHPHFRETRSLFALSWNGVWVDYKPYSPSESLACFISRIVKSLQFFPDFVHPEAEKIGNETASKWYQFAQKEYKNSYFPLNSIGITGAFSPCGSDKEESERLLEIERKGDDGMSPSTGEEAKFVILDEEDGLPNHNQPVLSSLSIESPEHFFRSIEHSLSHSHGTQKRDSSAPEVGSGHYFLLTTCAKSEIYDHVDWGTYTTRNQQEQGGLLLGQVIQGSEYLFGMVTDSVTSPHAKGNAHSLEMNHGTWSDMLRKVDALEQEQGRSLSVIGWYHTHPNELSVFMSGADRETQRKLFDQPWHFALVLNPHRKVWKVFRGPEAEPCSGAVIDLDDFRTD